MKLLQACVLAGLLFSGPAAKGDGRFPASLRLDPLDQPAPALGVSNGKTLADYRGRWVVLHFWATWCAPCVKELPSLDRLSERWKDRVAFFAVSIDEDGETSVPRFIRKQNIRIPVLLFRAVRAPERYWGWGVPVTYFINPKGRLVARAMGPRAWDSEDADRMLSEMIGAPVPATKATAAER